MTLSPVTSWQPIDTAHLRTSISERAVRVLLLCESGKVQIGWFDPDPYAKKPRPYWYLEGAFGRVGAMRADQPTHWMPLPATNVFSDTKDWGLPVEGKSARALALKWLNMPLHVQVSIMKANNAFQDGDAKLRPAELLQAFVERTDSATALKAIEESPDAP